MRRGLVCVFLISLSAIMLEVALTRIISVMMWYHFSYLVISMALLGFGIAGSRLAVSINRGANITVSAIANYALWFSLAALICPLVAGQIRLFNPLELYTHPYLVIFFGLYYVLLLLPFYFAGMALVMALQFFRSSFNRVYAADLLGAGAGCILVVCFLRLVSAPGALVLIAMLALSASFVIGGKQFRGWGVLRWVWLVLLVAALGFIEGYAPTLIKAPQIKAINQLTFDRQPEFTKWNALCRVDVSSEVLFSPWFGADINRSFRDRLYPMKIIFQDGTAPTPMYRDAGQLEQFPFLEHSTPAGIYLLYNKPEVLVIGPGGGVDIMIALKLGAKSVAAVELNPIICDAVTGAYVDYLGGLYQQPGVTLVNTEGRHYLEKTTDRFDIIQLTCIDTFTAMSIGAYCLSENYLYTVGAVESMWNCLKPGGLLMYSRHYFSPPRESLRVVTIMVDALSHQGILEPQRHLFAYGDTGCTVLLKKDGFSDKEATFLERFCSREGFRIYHHPYQYRDNPISRYINGDQRARQVFLSNYIYDVRPSTDDTPFFFQYYKWSNLWRFKAGTGHWGLKYPVSNIILLISLVQAVFLSAALILWPLRRLSHQSQAAPVRRWFWALAYFACLGAGYMTIEIVLIQKLTIFLGYPLRSLTVVLFVLLTSSGLGSAVSSRFSGQHPLKSLGVVILLLGCYAVCLLLITEHVASAYMGALLSVRVITATILIFPMGFLMGMPFPIGIRLLERRFVALVPWGWGINACFSVVGSLTAVVIAMGAGFRAAAIVAILFYAAGYLFLLTAAGRRMEEGGASFDVV